MYEVVKSAIEYLPTEDTHYINLLIEQKDNLELQVWQDRGAAQPWNRLQSNTTSHLAN